MKRRPFACHMTALPRIPLNKWIRCERMGGTTGQKHHHADNASRKAMGESHRVRPRKNLEVPCLERVVPRHGPYT